MLVSPPIITHFPPFVNGFGEFHSAENLRKPLVFFFEIWYNRAEMDNTAAATQAKRTEESRREMLVAREAAERQRAIADKAYQKELGLSTEQFIELRAWEIIAEKQGANIDVLFDAGGTNKMWNVRR